MSFSLLGKLYAQDFNLFDKGWFGEQFGRLRHKRFSYGPIQVSLTTAFIRERVEHAKSRRPQT